MTNNNSYSTRAHEAVMERIRDSASPGDSVLDVGCGDGSFLTTVKDELSVTAVGIDPFTGGNKGDSSSCKAYKAEEITKLGEKFDLVYSLNSTHHFEDPAEFTQNLPLVLKPGGEVIIADWKRGASTGIPESYYEVEYISDLLKEAGLVVNEETEFEKQLLVRAHGPS